MHLDDAWRIFPLQAKSTSESLDIYIPVEVEPWRADEENQAIEQQQEEEIDQRNAVTQFELKPIEGAPMPCSNTLTIDGCGKAEFGPIPASEPVDWSYELTEKLISGKDVELVDERIMIIRVGTFWDDDGTLFSSITATDAMADPTRQGDPDHPDQSESGKEETVFHIRLESEPSPKMIRARIMTIPKARKAANPHRKTSPPLTIPTGPKLVHGKQVSRPS